ncbi:phytosulfokine receptor 1-like [Nicotiana tabacum]|uniref:non-specific serine/threonine protein kinase n=1 Tax=Nicotiana tabacum TaxID=4097 RepID=A0A1S4BTM8_TOBAC|nr:PREDICTED: phytosulfokine receptor 1-like [Nicotiana tabacum]
MLKMYSFKNMLQLGIIFFFLGLSLQVQSQNPNFICNPNDFKALKDFVNSLETVVDFWDIRNSTNCCKWVGITCNSSSSSNIGRVVKLELGKRRLNGKLSESLGNLDQLRTLNLTHNFLKGSVPFKLLHLPNLEVLDLSNNDLCGVFPDSINLPSLKSFNISDNSFQGSVPLGICKNSTRVSVIKMGFNHFIGSLPTGIQSCGSLEHLCLGSNLLSGSLPVELFKLSRLTVLSLQENRFDGQLSSLIGNLSNLVHLDICSNGFSGNIPDVFHSLRNLTYFSAHSNRFFGKIPTSLANSGSITSLSLRNNSLGGTIELNCSAMISLVSLDLATNGFIGSVPDNLPYCPKLQTINLARNNFVGQIPESFKNFHSLSSLSVSNNSIHNIDAALRILQNCKNLTTLVLTLNFRDEELPTDPSLQFNELKALIIANCRLTGSVPQWLRNSSKMQLLDLSWNRLMGTLPPWIGDFKFLFYMDLSNNSLTGEIPKEITGLQSLISGPIWMNEPSPDFPFFLKRNVSVKGLQYNQIFSFPPTLELGNNFFTGAIWPEFGNLKRLHVLDLKSNNLSGAIPGGLSGMTSIEILDLSRNNLIGKIPSSLVKCSFLSKFSVAYNKLSGEVPTGGQFATFSNSSFEGNPGLCGEHSTTPCQNANQIPSGSAARGKRRKGTVIGMGIGIGLGTAFLLALMYLIVVRAGSCKVVDPEKEPDASNKDREDLGSSLVIFFHNKDNNKQMSLDDLLACTDNFDQSNIVGCGGFGLVYKAILRDGRKVAIKRLSGDYGQMEREFQAEVESLSRAQHPNLVHLQGYCKYRTDRLLIYSYMENGSLDYWLHEKVDGPALLDWDMRLQIAQGAARGLAYLHQACEPHILHRDIKSSNILLDENFEAHLADFGLARLILPYDTHVTTDVVGTLGYIPPEYGQASVATYKGDVYSFGVVLLELLTGKRPMDPCKPRASRDLISWVIQLKKQKRETEVFDPLVYNKQHAQEMLLVFEIACLCLHESPKIRPSSQQLVTWLDNINTPPGVHVF